MKTVIRKIGFLLVITSLWLSMTASNYIPSNGPNIDDADILPTKNEYMIKMEVN